MLWRQGLRFSPQPPGAVRYSLSRAVVIPRVVAVQLKSLGFRTDLGLLALGGSQVEDHRDHIIIRTPFNQHYWWGNFILLDGVPGADESQRWLGLFAKTFPNAEHVAIGFDEPDGTVADLAWFTARGFKAEAATVMTANEVHQPRRGNSEAVYRRLESDTDWEQSIDLRMRCEDRDFDPVIHLDFVTKQARTSRKLTARGKAAWFGAFIDDRLVAQMGLVCVSGDLARFQSVETEPLYRRRGLAGTLVHHASEYGFAELGAQTLVMIADPDYFAIDLYRTVGFAPAESQLLIERFPRGSSVPNS
jgi:GNAT superfamily N-acetyltransferase